MDVEDSIDEAAELDLPDEEFWNTAAALLQNRYFQFGEDEYFSAILYQIDDFLDCLDEFLARIDLSTDVMAAEDHHRGGVSFVAMRSRDDLSVKVQKKGSGYKFEIRDVTKTIDLSWGLRSDGKTLGHVTGRLTRLPGATTTGLDLLFRVHVNGRGSSVDKSVTFFRFRSDDQGGPPTGVAIREPKETWNRVVSGMSISTRFSSLDPTGKINEIGRRAVQSRLLSKPHLGSVSGTGRTGGH